MELQADDDSWTSYTGTVDPKQTIRLAIPLLMRYPSKAVTASAAGATLTIEDLSPAPSSIYVYPNPTANRIYIQAENITKAEPFDLMGRKVKATNQDQIDLSNISSGSYIPRSPHKTILHNHLKSSNNETNFITSSPSHFAPIFIF